LRGQSDLNPIRPDFLKEIPVMKLLTLLYTLIVFAAPLASFAQGAGGPGPAPIRDEPTDDLRTRNALSQSEMKLLAEQIEQWNRVEGKAGVPPRMAKVRTASMLKVLNVSCAVTQAAYRGTAPDAPAKKVYEAACEDGMGYLLTLQDSTLTGTSCLATTGESPVRCALPANADGRVMAGNVLARREIQCKVRDSRWLGANAAGLDHVEVACENGDGYVIRTPHLGLSGELDVFDCQEAIKRGVRCELSAQAAAPASPADARPSLAWFKDALARHGVACQSKRARIIGRESIKRRYLVEFDCTDRPDGLVTFVPMADDTVNAFESMNCPSAAGRGIRCEWANAGTPPSPN
jgi:hypothetical protein